MKSTVENINPTRAKIEMVATPEELQPSLDAVYRQVEQVAIPGFRKGKVPQEMLKKRVGAPYVLEQAVNDSLTGFYQEALEEHKIFPLSQPEVDVVDLPDPETMEGDLKFTLEMDIRPEIELPDYKDLEVEVDPIEATPEDIDDALKGLQTRFAELKKVDAPAAKDHHVSIDMVAKVDGEEVDNAKGINYQLGSGNMLEGMDEALEGLSADEDAVLNTKLAGGEHAGKDAEVKVKVNSVKERELPEADDDFAQMASEFDTIDELKDSLKEQVASEKEFQQKVQAHERTLDALLEKVDIPVPDGIVDEEVKRHFEASQEDTNDEAHMEEVRENAKKAFQSQLLLDHIAEKRKEGVEVGQQELIEYIMAQSQQYGMDPNQFAQMLDQSGQTNALVGEVGRKKALAKVVEGTTVKDADGNIVDATATEQVDEDDASETAEDVNSDEDTKSDDKRSLRKR